jgi:hypothetical protein
VVPSTSDETTENGPSNEIIPSESEMIITTTTTTEEVTKTTTVVGDGEALATSADESTPIEAITDGMDTSE